MKHINATSNPQIQALIRVLIRITAKRIHINNKCIEQCVLSMASQSEMVSRLTMLLLKDLQNVKH